jgi:hypothetical protein
MLNAATPVPSCYNADKILNTPRTGLPAMIGICGVLALVFIFILCQMARHKVDEGEEDDTSTSE